MAEKLYCH